MNLHNTITMRGRDEQERQYLFSGLYGNHAVTRRERGRWMQLERRIRRETRNKKFQF